MKFGQSFISSFSCHPFKRLHQHQRECCSLFVNLVAPIWPILILFHPFSVILSNGAILSICCPLSEHLLASIWPIPTLSHPFPAILSIPKASEIDLIGPVKYGGLDPSPFSQQGLPTYSTGLLIPLFLFTFDSCSVKRRFGRQSLRKELRVAQTTSYVTNVMAHDLPEERELRLRNVAGNPEPR